MYREIPPAKDLLPQKLAGTAFAPNTEELPDVNGVVLRLRLRQGGAAEGRQSEASSV